MIAKSAIIDKSVKIGKNVSIGEYSVIGAHVSIGDNCSIASHVVIKGRTIIGENNKILQFTSIGEDPQDLKYKNEDTLLEIGNNNTIREFCTLNRGTAQGGGITKVGNNNLLMSYVHVAHDCIIGSGNVMANNTTFAGHIIVHDNVLFGGFAAIAQFCRIGSYSFVAGKSAVSKDVPPFVLVSGAHGATSPYGLNLIGLKRRGFSLAKIRLLKEAYKILYKENLTINQAIEEIKKLSSNSEELMLFIDFIVNSKIGIMR